MNVVDILAALGIAVAAFAVAANALISGDLLLFFVGLVGVRLGVRELWDSVAELFPP